LSVEKAGSEKKFAVQFNYLFTLSKELRSGAEWRREGLQSHPSPNKADTKKIKRFIFSEPASSTLNSHLFWSQEKENIISTKMYHIKLLNSP
jgi:hypothetical protein